MSPDPAPTLPLPLKRREIATFLPLQGGGHEGDGAYTLPLPKRYFLNNLIIYLWTKFAFTLGPFFMKLSNPICMSSVKKHSPEILASNFNPSSRVILAPSKMAFWRRESIFRLRCPISTSGSFEGMGIGSFLIG
jgi:hypothetical protein